MLPGIANARLGRSNEARAIISRFKEISKTHYVMSFFVATIYAALGEKDAAFAEMENGLSSSVIGGCQQCSSPNQ